MMVMDVGPRAHGSVRKGFSGAQKYGGRGWGTDGSASSVNFKKQRAGDC